MSMGNYDNKQLLWSHGEWRHIGGEVVARIPKQILECENVSRVVQFKSLYPIKKLKLVQIVYFHGNKIEEWSFDFGFVIPKSLNNWEQIISSEGKNVLPADILSGNVIIDSTFYDGDQILSNHSVRIFYV